MSDQIKPTSDVEVQIAETMQHTKLDVIAQAV